MIWFLVLVLGALATARGTRFIVHDYLSKPFQRWVIRRFGEESKPAYLVTCEACSSIWVGFVVSLITTTFLVYGAGQSPWLWLVAPLQVLAYSEAAIKLIDSEE